MTAYLKSLPFGAPGVQSRPHVHTNEAQVIDQTAPPTAYGQPIKMVAGKVQTLAVGDTAANLYGFLVRPYPSQDYVYNPGFGSSAPPTTGTCDVMRRGYMLVHVGAGTAVAQGVVYVRVAAPVAGKPIGGIEAVADGSNNVVIAGATFQTAADAAGVAEIAYNI